MSRIKSALKIQEQDAPANHFSVRHVSITCLLLALAALAERVSHLNLTPIYGSIPASAYHTVPQVIAILISGTCLLFGIAPAKHVLTLALPMHAAIVPALLHYVLAPASSTLGPEFGPVVTELVTLTPILSMTLALALVINEHVPIRETKGGDVILISLFSLIHLSTGSLLDAYLLPYIGLSPYLTRWSLSILITSAYILLYPSKLLFAGLVPALSFLLQTSPHGSLPGNIRHLNRNLRVEGFSLLERRESVTGYLSVLQNERDSFRVLRCDHSLLGGVWLPTEARRAEGVLAPEPVFPVFTMLEAVRLMQSTSTPEPPEEPSPGPKIALVIGLGIGTCPAAFSAHGINTTTLELDPAVTALAVAHFAFGAAERVLHGDAVATAAQLKAAGDRFDYIVHDVFTGGAEPLPLFEPAFLDTLTALLKPGGSIAINYAGDLTEPSTSLLLRTILRTLPHCRLFRDDAPKPAGQGPDFANFVAFCRADEWTFRTPHESDFLGSQARRHYMLPKWEVTVSDLDEGLVLSDDTRGMVERAQVGSACEHWRIMRGVLPDGVWLNW